MYHSLIINVDDDYIDTWDDWKLIPSSRPVIAPPIERTKLVALELVHPQKTLVVVAGAVLQCKPHPLALQAFADGGVRSLPVPALVVVLKVEFDLSAA